MTSPRRQSSSPSVPTISRKRRSASAATMRRASSESYVARGILDIDPFIAVDRDGVGELVKIGVQRGRKTRPGLKMGICGEHGGDPSSVAFCHEVGLDYVSCSPYRVPIASPRCGTGRAWQGRRQSGVKLRFTRSLNDFVLPGLVPGRFCFMRCLLLERRTIYLLCQLTRRLRSYSTRYLPAHSKRSRTSKPSLACGECNAVINSAATLIRYERNRSNCIGCAFDLVNMCMR